MFHELLVKLRLERGLTQKKLAELLGITPTRLNYWEKGTREPNVEMIKRISEVLGVQADVLLELDEITQTYELITTDEEEVLTLYRGLDEGDKGEIRGEMKQMLKADKYQDQGGDLYA